MDKIDALISRFFDDALSDEQFAELESWINESEKNAAAFAAAATDHSNLRELCHGDLVYESLDLADEANAELNPATRLASKSVGRACAQGSDLGAEAAAPENVASRWASDLSQSLWSSGMSAALQVATLAAALLIGVFGTLRYQEAYGPARSTAIATGSSESSSDIPPHVPVARLVDFGGDLQTDLLIPRNGSELQPGQVVTISNGFGNLSFGRGAELQLEGPLALTVGGSASCSIKYGRLIAESGRADEFRISTTLAEVIAWPGSTVGVSTFGEVVNVMAMNGTVCIRAKDQHGDDVLLHEGESYRLFFTPNGEVKHKHVALSSDDFPVFKTMGSERLAITDDYIESIMLSQPLAYWRFDRVLDETVLCETEGGPDLDIFGNLRFREEDGNASVLFGLHTDTGFLATQTQLMPEGANEYTIELWANPTHCHSGVLVSLADTYLGANEPERHGLLLEFEGPGHTQWAVGLRRRLRFLHRPQLSVNAHDGTNLHPPTEYIPGHWHHICAVRSGEDLRLQVDGQVVATGADQGRLPAGLSLKIGQLYLSAPVRQFAGLIDEVAIYDRALSVGEVLNHYRHVRRD